MPAPIPRAHREEIVRRKAAGESLEEIAQSLGYSYWGVRKIWRQYQKQGEEGLRLKYRKERGTIRKRVEVYQKAIEWKREHRGWGAGLVRSLLLREWPVEEVPSVSHVQPEANPFLNSSF